MLRKLLISLVLLAFAQMAKAAKIEYDDWVVHAKSKDDQLYCFAMSTPSKQDKTIKKRNAPYVMVTHISKKTDEVSATAGFDIKDGSKVTLAVDGTNYRTDLIETDMAWMQKDQQDKALVRMFKKGKKLKVAVTSVSGATVTDEYSLKGFSRAYRRMKFLCSHVDLKK